MKRSLSVVVLAIAATVAIGRAQAPQAPAPQAPPIQGRGPAPAPVVIGPPAPVPPEVAIPRRRPPNWRRSTRPSRSSSTPTSRRHKPLLQRFESLMMLQPPRLNRRRPTRRPCNARGPRHEGFVEIAKKGNIDLLLHGDSITDWWVQGDANKAMFDKYFGDIKTANFAIAGDTTQGVLWGLKNGEGQGYQPKAVMLMIGTNNTGGTRRTGNRRRHRRRHPARCARIFRTPRS